MCCSDLRTLPKCCCPGPCRADRAYTGFFSEHIGLFSEYIGLLQKEKKIAKSLQGKYVIYIYIYIYIDR